MLQVELHKTFDIAAWRDLVTEMDGSPLHLPQSWLVGSSPKNMVYIIFKQAQKTVAVSIGIRRDRLLFRVIPFSKSLCLPTVPACTVDTEVDRGEIYRVLISAARGNGFKFLAIEPRWGDDFSETTLFGSAITERLLEFVIDLSGTEEQLLGAMHKKHRKNIRTALESGLEFVHDPSWEAFTSIRAMQQESSERASERGNVFHVAEDAFYTELFKQVYERGPGEILFARKNGNSLAFLAYLTLGTKAITVRSGSTREGYDLSAMYLLQYELIRQLKVQGVTELNIGAVPAAAMEPNHPEHGLYNYKRYYGGKACLRTGVSLTL